MIPRITCMLRIAILAVSIGFASSFNNCHATRRTTTTTTSSLSLRNHCKPAAGQGLLFTTARPPTVIHFSTQDKESVTVEEESALESPLLPINDDVKNNNEDDYSLQFVGHTVFRSEPLPLPPTSSEITLMDFFSDFENRCFLLLGEGAPEPSPENPEPLPRVEPVTDTSPDLIQRWKGEASRLESEPNIIPPNFDEDDLLLVKSSGIPFLLTTKILVDSTVSAKLIQPGKEHQFPGYQFMLIKDVVRVEGPRPLVWLHNKIMKAKDFRKQTTHSYSHLRVEAATDMDEHVVFVSDSRIEINVHVPKLMVKLLPMSREAANKQGSAAIQKSFEVKGAPALVNFVQAYKNWYAEINE